MCDECSWAPFVQTATEVLHDLGQLINHGSIPTQQAARKDHVFVKGLRAWAETNGHVTPRMTAALDRVRASTEVRLRSLVTS